MKLVVEKEPFLRVLGHLQSVAERRRTIPILSNALIETAPGGIMLEVTDMDIGLIETLPLKVERPGKFTVGVRTLYDIVRKLKDGAQIELDFVSEKGRPDELVVRSGRSVFTVATLPHEDFPRMSAGEMPTAFTVPSAELRNLIDHVRFAISTEETRYYLCGIYLHVAQNDEQVGVLRGVSTDGHRLARYDLTLPEGARGMGGIIVPRKTVIEVRKLLDGAKDTDEIAIRASDTKIEFKVGEATMTSKVIDGTFPDYDRVIPKGNDKIITVSTDDLKDAVDRVATIATERTRAIKFDFGDGRIEVSASSPENGRAVEEVEARYRGAAFHAGFNHRYVLDIAAQMGGEVEWRLSDGGSPTILADPANAAGLYVLMPMRVS